MIQTDILLNGMKILQDPDRFMFGIDAILLADFARKELRRNEKVFDLCTGNGIVPLLLKDSAAHIDAIEIQPDSAKLAQDSVELNSLSEKIKITVGDLKSIPLGTKNFENQGSVPLSQNDFESQRPVPLSQNDFENQRPVPLSQNNSKDQRPVPLAVSFEKHSYNSVTCNPPYMIAEHGRQNTTDAKTIARHEVFCSLEDVISAADYLLHTHGKFFMIHRPFRLPEIFTCLKKYNLEPKRMQLVYPFVDKEPNLVLIEARKNASARLQIEKPLFVYEKPGVYTKEINEIYDSFRN